METPSHQQSVPETDQSKRLAVDNGEVTVGASGHIIGSPEDLEWARRQATEKIVFAAVSDSAFAPFRRLLDGHTQ
jgi:hypothetical protein